jgi:hypothetical protein
MAGTFFRIQTVNDVLSDVVSIGNNQINTFSGYIKVDGVIIQFAENSTQWCVFNSAMSAMSVLGDFSVSAGK